MIYVLYRIGGRIWSANPGMKDGEGIVELGGTVIHGACKENPVYDLATKFGMSDLLEPIQR